ncbi:hypothetical protein [Bradyrhizobium canariense]|uniref:Uncharacterized protein n=1 Tax=Bradyrhizobium canariense TaxID=255045 RepID=A0A1H1VIV4_9BRAD|nr:hypothetical protein [Bradyrhizobium canariense]SDS84788.1 hypothetical protein SAMN05444158_3436 [Bradyrhizobium canariense]
MDESDFRQQADRCRRRARDSSDPDLRVALFRMGDELQMMADEIENDEIIFAERKNVEGARRLRSPNDPNGL